MARRANIIRRTSLVMSTLLACCGIASALNPSLDVSQYAHTAWTARDGLFNGTVTSIAQTPDGYLWLGTEFGLLRFDGVRFAPWLPPSGEPLPSGYVSRLLVGRDGRLWIGTDKGLASWQDGKLARYPELDGQTVGALLEDREGTVWAGAVALSTGGLCSIGKGGVQCYGKDGSIGRGVVSLYEDREGNLWAGSATGLWRWKPGPPKRYPTSDQVTEIDALIESDNGAIWMAMPGGIRQLANGKVEAYPLPGSGGHFRPNHLLRDRNGGLWIGTQEGLLHTHRGRTDLFTRSDGLSGDFIDNLFQDREGNIWVATRDGLDRFRDFAVPTISVAQGLSNTTAVSVLAGRDGSVWLGTNDGLNRWNDGRVTVYRKGSSGLPDDGVGSLFQDDHERIWVTTVRGVAYFEDGRFISATAVPGGFVHAIAGDSLGNLWIGLQEQGLFHLLDGSVVERTPWVGLGRKDLVYAMVFDPAQGGLWLGFVSGRIVFWKDGQVRASYSVADGLGEGPVNSLQLDLDGALWAATQGGLSSVKNGRVATLTGKNGLPCDTVHWVLEDDDHSFWLYTACGLMRIAQADLDAWVLNPRHSVQATVFDSTDGVRVAGRPGTSYRPIVAKTADGKIWFVAGDGVSVIDPRHLPFNQLPPPVHIEQIIADRKTSEASPNLRLPALTRDLEIDYTALSLVAPEKNRYRVKLEGHDRDWIDMGNERKKFYNDLPPRNYRFRVMASNNNGVWNEAGAAFDFSVAPAYYQTAWFQALCAFAGLAVLWGLYRYRLHQIAREFNVRLDERVGERTRIARDLHDTLLQSFQGLMLHFQIGVDRLPPGNVRDELEKALEKGDQAIAEGRSAVYDLRSSATTTNDLAQAIREVGNELATPGAATFRLMVEGPSRDLHPIVRDELYRIAREALRNAFSHSQAHHIETELIYTDRQFQLRIRDDGQGIPTEILEEGRPGHYGLPGMRERAKQIGAKLTIWSGTGTGTEIELSVEGPSAYGGTLPGPSRLRLFRKKVG